MAQITAKDLSTLISIGDVEETARQNWERTQRRRRGISQWLVRSLPVALMIMLIVFYALSAPHTAELLNKITPGVGWLAPVGFELGVLIVAALREAGWRSPNWRTDLTRWILYLLLLMSIAINVAGGFVSVVSVSLDTDIQGNTLQAMLSLFPELPATAQIVLMLVIPMGVLIPIMGKFAGEAVIKFSLNKISLSTENDEDRWLKDRRKLLQQALYAAAVKLGAGAVTAGDWSQRMVYHWYKEAVQERVTTTEAYASTRLPDAAAMPVPTANRDFGFAALADNRTIGQYGLTGNSVQQGQSEPLAPVHNVHENPDSGRTADGQTTGRRRDAREIVREYLRANPDSVNMNVRSLADLLRVGKSTVSEVQREFREGK
jgi:hypothetical protein